MTSVGSIRQAFDDALTHLNGTVDDGGIFENYIYPKFDMYEGTNPAVVIVYKDAPQNFGGASPITVKIFTDVEVGDDFTLGNTIRYFYEIYFIGYGSNGILRIADYHAGMNSLPTYVTVFTGEYDNGSGDYCISSIDASVLPIGAQNIPVQWKRAIDGATLSTSFEIIVEAATTTTQNNEEE